MKFKALKSFFQCHVAKFRVQMREICLIESMHVKLRKVTRNNERYFALFLIPSDSSVFSKVLEV